MPADPKQTILTISPDGARPGGPESRDKDQGREASRQPGDFDLRLLCQSLRVEYLELGTNARIPQIVRAAADLVSSGRPVVVEVAIDYSRKTFFTEGVMQTNLRRLPLPDQLRFISRAVYRKAAAVPARLF